MALEAAAAADPKWVVRREALGRTQSKGLLAVCSNSVFSSLNAINEFGRKRFGSQVDSLGHESVDVVPLDSIREEFAPRGSRRILLKVDTQGSDLDVLAGAADTMNDVVATLSEASVVPIYDKAARLIDLIQTMEGHGLVLSSLFPISHDHPPSLALLELDCYFVRIEHAIRQPTH
jgi:FkbM family methyltransferase